MKLPRIAAIDIGTNSIRCIIAEVSKDGKYRILDDEKATVRLGERLALRESCGNSSAISGRVSKAPLPVRGFL